MKRSTASRRDDGSTVEQSEVSGRDNDVSWYAANEYMLRDAASIPFSNPAGIPIKVENPVDGSTTMRSMNTPIPSIFEIELVPAVGTTKNGALAPINVAARNIFAFIRANQTVSAAYNQCSVMLMILAMSSAYSFYSFCTRAYGLIRTYAQRNRALPEALFKTMGLDYTDFMTNIADFRYWLNTFAEKVGALCIPASMSYIMRQVWLYQNVFLDGPTDKSQMYIYNPKGFFKYNPIGHGTAPDVTPNVTLSTFDDGTLKTVNDVIAYGNDLISTLFMNNIINTISGDILKSYGADKVWRLLPIPEDYVVVPTISLEVLDQIHNMFMPRPVQELDQVEVYEYIDAETATAYLKAEYNCPTKASETPRIWYFGSKNLLIDFDRNEVSPADVMVATRLTAMVNEFNSGQASSNLATKDILCGSELAVALRVWRNASGTSFDAGVLNQNGTNDFLARPFYKHPIMYSIAGTDPAALTLNINSDIENVTQLGKDVLTKLHEAALLSEFHVPLMGRLIN